MYGRTDVPEFRGLEGYEDHDVGSLFFWNKAGKLIGIVVNVSCPRRRSKGDRRQRRLLDPIARRCASVTARKCTSWAGSARRRPVAAPDVPQGGRGTHAELRGLTRLKEIARRIERAVDETYEAVKRRPTRRHALMHKVETIALPMRLVTEAEYAEAKAAASRPPTKSPRIPRRRTVPAAHEVAGSDRAAVRKTERPTRKPTYEVELHVLRIGDAVVCTNPFELFTDYGIRIKARSKAVQTFVVQLVGPGSYLPTEKAVRGGGYSAVVQSNLVGPEGGQVLVDRTVELIDALWTKAN